MSKTASPRLRPNAAEQVRRLPVLLVTGMSGAGRSTALKTLEDMGYEAVDNLPLSLLSNLAQSASPGRALAIGVDIRTRDFGVAPFLHEIDALRGEASLNVSILFLECEDEVLRRRYTETRRRHPLAADRPVTDGIRHERRLVSPLKARADVVVDTSNLQLGDLRRILGGHYALEETAGLSIFVMSFSYRHGLPPEADIVLDVRFLRNPHYVEALRPHTGEDERVAAFIRADPDYAGFIEAVTTMLRPLLPRFLGEGKSYLTIAVGCTGGRHRSVFVAREIASWLRDMGERVQVGHRDAGGAASLR